jgi:predicted lipoprotein with Yx(FWY)xxD motif
MTTLRRTLVMIALAASTATASACGVRDLGTSAGTAAPPAATAALPATEPGRATLARHRAGTAAPILRATPTRQHGTLVVDADGLTLYRSDRDSANPPTSRCAGACTELWKPELAVDTDRPVAGIDPAIVGTVVRPDGTRQLTIAGWPIYRFAKDVRPGDVAGQCKGGFFAVTPTGGRSM